MIIPKIRLPRRFNERMGCALFLLLVLVSLLLISLPQPTCESRRRQTNLLLTDFGCINRFLKRIPCRAPVSVAAIDECEGNSTDWISDFHRRLDYLVDEETLYIRLVPQISRVYLSEIIIPRYSMRKNVPVLMNDSTTQYFDIPVNIDLYKSDWRAGQRTYCNNQENGTMQDLAPGQGMLGFVYDKIRERTSMFNARVFLIDETYLHWRRTCEFPPNLHMGIYLAEWSDSLLNDLRRLYNVTELESGVIKRYEVKVEKTRIQLDILPSGPRICPGIHGEYLFYVLCS